MTDVIILKSVFFLNYFFYFFPCFFCQHFFFKIFTYFNFQKRSLRARKSGKFREHSTELRCFRGKFFRRTSNAGTFQFSVFWKLSVNKDTYDIEVYGRRAWIVSCDETYASLAIRCCFFFEKQEQTLTPPYLHSS